MICPHPPFFSFYSQYWAEVPKQGLKVLLGRGCAGLINRISEGEADNLCFLNSFLRGFANNGHCVVGFRPLSRQCQHVSDAAGGKLRELASKMSTFIKQYWANDTQLRRGEQRVLSVAKEEVKPAIVAWKNKYRGNKQHDVEELFRDVMGGLNQAFDRSWLRDAIAWIENSTITCDSCKRMAETPQEMWVVQLHIK